MVLLIKSFFLLFGQIYDRKFDCVPLCRLLPTVSASTCGPRVPRKHRASPSRCRSTWRRRGAGQRQPATRPMPTLRWPRVSFAGKRRPPIASTRRATDRCPSSRYFLFLLVCFLQEHFVVLSRHTVAMNLSLPDLNRFSSSFVWINLF